MLGINIIPNFPSGVFHLVGEMARHAEIMIAFETTDSPLPLFHRGFGRKAQEIAFSTESHGQFKYNLLQTKLHIDPSACELACDLCFRANP